MRLLVFTHKGTKLPGGLLASPSRGLFEVLVGDVSPRA